MEGGGRGKQGNSDYALRYQRTTIHRAARVSQYEVSGSDVLNLHPCRLGHTPGHVGSESGVRGVGAVEHDTVHFDGAPVECETVDDGGVVEFHVVVRVRNDAPPGHVDCRTRAVHREIPKRCRS